MLAASPPIHPATSSLTIPAMMAWGWSSFSMATASPSSGIIPMCSTMVASALRGSFGPQAPHEPAFRVDRDLSALVQDGIPAVSVCDFDGLYQALFLDDHQPVLLY